MIYIRTYIRIDVYSNAAADHQGKAQDEEAGYYYHVIVREKMSG